MVFKKALSGVGKFFKKFKVLIILLLVGFIILTFVRYSTNSAKKLLGEMSDAGAETAEVEPRNLVETVTATGTVESAKTRTMASTIMKDTKITSVNCEVGDYVQEGDILVTFSYENINKTISQLKEDIAESNATKSVNDTANTRTYYYSYGTEEITIRDLQQAIDEKKRDLDRACADYGDAKRKLDDLKNERDQMPDYVESTTNTGQPGVSGNAVQVTWVENSAKKEYSNLIESQENTVTQAYRTQENAQLAYDKAVQALEDEVYKGSHSLAGATETYQKNVITSNDSTKQLKRQLEEQEDKLDDYVITAPISGTVTKVNVEENNSFSGGDLVTIQDCSTLYVSTEIDEYDIPNIQVGQKVKLKTDATRDDELDGVIDEIAATATAAAQGQASSGNATYKVKVKVLTGDDRLKLGMTAKLSIIINEVDNVLTVPYDAVVDLGEGQYVVYTLDDEALRKLEKRKAATEQMKSAIADMQKGDPGKIQDMSKDSESANAINEAFADEDDNEKKGFFGGLANIFKVAYGSQDDQDDDFLKENQIEVPVEVGIESDYYTQVSGAGIKQGMTVIVQSTEEADNPFELMMGL